MAELPSVGYTRHKLYGLCSHLAYLTAEVVAWLLLIQSPLPAPLWPRIFDTLKWFTVQTNVFCICLMAAAIALDLRELLGKGAPPGWFSRLRACGTVSILVVGVVFTILWFNGLESYNNAMFHLIGPLWFALDFLLTDRPGGLRWWDGLWNMVPTMSYTLFSYLIYIPLTGEYLYPEVMTWTPENAPAMLLLFIGGTVAMFCGGLVLWGLDRLKLKFGRKQK